MTYAVGLTGGIATGKTTVSQYFRELNIPIIDADVIAHEITAREQPAYEAILKHFGLQVLNSDRSLNRRKLREIIFNDLAQKEWLENLLHPMIRLAIKQAVEAVTAPYCICSIPLLMSVSTYPFLNRVLVVDVSPDVQLKRATARDHHDPVLIAKMMASQQSREARLAIADDVLVNEGNLVYLKAEVAALDQRYRVLAQQQLL